jgi:hypothetical protein
MIKDMFKQINNDGSSFVDRQLVFNQLSNTNQIKIEDQIYNNSEIFPAF